MSWLTSLNAPEHPRGRVLAVPHAGGWPTSFTPWRDHLDPRVELSVAELPGRAARGHEPAPESLEQITTAVVAELAAAPRVPTTVLGHSFGAVAGYEIARAMEAAGMAPVRFVASARQPPAFRSVAPFSHSASDEDLTRRLTEMGGLAQGLSNRPDVAAKFLAAIRADLALMETHVRPRVPAGFPISAVLGSRDPVVMGERMPMWAVETTGPFEIETFEGDHFFLYRKEVAAALADRITAELLAVGEPATATAP